ncbi:MAG: 1,4-dihydroxy-6-naphthoate synthase [Trueperaceae bacterium]|nr:1,4-dihydroxy-6-naphthoate synthase [Trueperaceae bacterium]
MRLTLGFSPCPNDTFIFNALVHGLLEEEAPEQEPLEFEVVLGDVEALNQAALAGSLDVSKVSCHAYGHLAAKYQLLRSGGAMGHGTGPLLVSRDPNLDLAGASVAIPGGLTTANLLLRLWRNDMRLQELRYDRIMPAVAAGEFDAGLIIHESRFTYADHGLACHVDLGAWWEGESRQLVPLGVIAVRRDLGPAVIARIQRLVRRSVEHAFAHPQASAEYVKAHAQEMSADVRQRHIDLYVNEHSVDVGESGESALTELLARGAALGLFPTPTDEVFVPEVPVQDLGMNAPTSAVEKR